MSGWSDEDVETLKKLTLEGLSASQIASHFPSHSRNSVIGKLSRIGLQLRGGRASPITMKMKRPAPPWAIKPPISVQAKKVRGAEMVSAAKTAAGVDNLAGHSSAAVTELRGGCCKWPLGDPGHAGFAFCSAPTGARRTAYCPGHASAASTPAKPSNIDKAARWIRRTDAAGPVRLF